MTVPTFRVVITEMTSGRRELPGRRVTVTVRPVRSILLKRLTGNLTLLNTNVVTGVNPTTTNPRPAFKFPVQRRRWENLPFKVPLITSNSISVSLHFPWTIPAKIFLLSLLSPKCRRKLELRLS